MLRTNKALTEHLRCKGMGEPDRHGLCLEAALGKLDEKHLHLGPWNDPEPEGLGGRGLGSPGCAGMSGPASLRALTPTAEDGQGKAKHTSRKTFSGKGSIISFFSPISNPMSGGQKYARN